MSEGTTTTATATATTTTTTTTTTNNPTNQQLFASQKNMHNKNWLEERQAYNMLSLESTFYKGKGYTLQYIGNRSWVINHLWFVESKPFQYFKAAVFFKNPWHPLRCASGGMSLASGNQWENVGFSLRGPSIFGCHMLLLIYHPLRFSWHLEGANVYF